MHIARAERLSFDKWNPQHRRVVYGQEREEGRETTGRRHRFVIAVIAARLLKQCDRGRCNTYVVRTPTIYARK